MAALSRLIGKSPTYIFSYMKKEIPHKMPLETRQALARALGKDYSFAEDPDKKPTPGFAYNQTVPVYGFASGTNSALALNDGAIIDYMPRHNPAMGNDGFYMIVVGDSMEPRYEQGERVAVSRVMPPKKGKDCVIEFIDGTAVIKRFINMTEKEIVCEQINPAKRLTYSRPEIVKVYAVVGHEF